MNAILGRNLSIVTPKPQTTRYKIFGIYTSGITQIVFVDTPGILKPKYELQNFMKREVESSFIEADVILLLIDVSKYESDELNQIFNEYGEKLSKHKVFCVINKIDLTTKEFLLLIINDISKKFNFDEIIPISAKSAFNIDELLKTIVKYLPDSEFFYGTEAIATQPERFFVSEIIREQALLLFGEEIPYSIYVEIDEFKEHKSAKDFIRANIVVERNSQRKIIIGTSGAMIKKLGVEARKEIERFLDRPVYLELHAKVRKNWKNNEKFLKNEVYAGIGGEIL